MITITKHLFMIENYLGILYLSPTKIIVQLKQKQMVICGLKLEIDYYSSVEIRGSGDIEWVRFIDGM